MHLHRGEGDESVMAGFYAEAAYHKWFQICVTNYSMYHCFSKAHCALVCKIFHGPFCKSGCVLGADGDTNSADLLSTAFLQPVNHLLKLQKADLHLLFQLVDKRIVVRVQVVVGLLCVQAESCRGREKETDFRHDESMG